MEQRRLVIGCEISLEESGSKIRCNRQTEQQDSIERFLHH
jgi:hypothetical protein